MQYEWHCKNQQIKDRLMTVRSDRMEIVFHWNIGSSDEIGLRREEQPGGCLQAALESRINIFCFL